MTSQNPTLDSIISDIIIYRFYLSMLRRRHFPYIGARQELATLIYKLASGRPLSTGCPTKHDS